MKTFMRLIMVIIAVSAVYSLSYGQKSNPFGGTSAIWYITGEVSSFGYDTRGSIENEGVLDDIRSFNTATNLQAMFAGNVEQLTLSIDDFDSFGTATTMNKFRVEAGMKLYEWFNIHAAVANGTFGKGVDISLGTSVYIDVRLPTEDLLNGALDEMYIGARCNIALGFDSSFKLPLAETSIPENIRLSLEEQIMPQVNDTMSMEIVLQNINFAVNQIVSSLDQKNIAGTPFYGMVTMRIELIKKFDNFNVGMFTGLGIDLFESLGIREVTQSRKGQWGLMLSINF